VVLIPTIVLAESLRILEKKRLLLKFKDVLKKLEVGWNYSPVPLDMRVVSRLPAFKRLAEIHDRIVVASAAIFNATLITKDELIVRTGYVRTVW